ncbi:MAG: 4Fe-4S dicluster domain-containing protein [Candidatus Altiarchaeales archaeon]|nr:4Fe-4S dicluster domain-containing protein [Candidatus Altiarchaeales archaeon]MBD3416091.1 4Fe-4S dicluster domain-containing protein [Candidatus Altiarchaeales archaeon]
MMVFTLVSTAGVAAALTLVPLGMIAYIALRNQSNAVLCMECQQCRAVCPIVAVEGDYIGPKDIMVAVKSGRYDDAVKGHVELCSGCGACVERCPRKLGVDELCMDIYNRELKGALEDDAISGIQAIPNPQMKRTYEAVVRRIKGSGFNLPWMWITKAQRLRKFFNPFEDDLKKAEVGGEAIEDLKKLREGLKFRR